MKKTINFYEFERAFIKMGKKTNSLMRVKKLYLNILNSMRNQLVTK